MRRTRTLLAVLCILIVLAGALLAPASGGSTSAAVLVPLAPLFGLVVLPSPAADDPTPEYAYLVSGPRPSRAPPSVA